MISWIAWGTKPARHYQLVRAGSPVDVFVHHCGHPTAIWPYYITRDADGRGDMTLAPNGRGFRLLTDAKAAAVALTEAT